MTDNRAPPRAPDLERAAAILRDAKIIVDGGSTMPPQDAASPPAIEPDQLSPVTDTVPAKGASAPRRGARRGRARGSADAPARPSDFDGYAHTIDADWRPWCDPDSDAVYVCSRYGARWENHPAQSKGPSGLLNAACYAATRKPLPAATAERVLDLLETETRIRGPFKKAALRVLRNGDTIYFDLHNDDREVVKVTAAGWEVVPASPDLPFVAVKGMKAAARPEPGGDPRAFARFFTTETSDGILLVLAWLMGAMGALSGALPICVINGPQGAGKSTRQQMLRHLTDPNHVSIQSPPTKEDDFQVIAAAAHVYSIDNVSKMAGWLYDALCRLATGGGFQARKKFTDAEISQIVLKRPVLVNGIPALNERADFADRMVGIRLRPILETERRTEEEIWADFYAASPEMMGVLFDGLSSGLRRYREVKAALGTLPRMADFLVWAEACAPGLGIDPGEIVRAFEANRAETTAATFEADPVCGAVCALVPDMGDIWSGNSSTLLSVLNTTVDEAVMRSYAWPKSAQALSVRLDRAEPLLRQNGVVCTRRRGAASRDILLTRTAPGPAAPAYDEENHP